jgi:arylsulfatase A-like enzyme
MHPPNDPPAEYRQSFCRGPLGAIGGRELQRRIETGEFALDRMPAARSQLRCLHLATLAQVDRYVSPVLAALMEEPRRSDTLVILLADHGEDLYEKTNTYTKRHVYEPSARIPLLVRAPGAVGGADRNDLVSLVDVPQTVYGYTRLPAPDGIRGFDLLGARKREDDPEAWSFVQGWDPEHDGFAEAVLFADGRKWIRDARGNDELYDLNTDPSEHTDLSSYPELADRYRELVERALASLVRVESRPVPVDALSRRAIEQLEALGYLRADPGR